MDKSPLNTMDKKITRKSQSLSWKLRTNRSELPYGTTPGTTTGTTITTKDMMTGPEMG